MLAMNVSPLFLKSVLSGVLLSSCFVSVANANTGNVRFLGSVTAQTCDVVVDIGGTSSATNVVSLGSVAAGATSTGTSFALKAINQPDAGCAALAASKDAIIRWSSASLNSNGFGAVGAVGAADANVLLTSVNSKTVNQAINTANPTSTFTQTLVTSDGFKYLAKIKGGTAVGDFYSDASFAIAYK